MSYSDKELAEIQTRLYHYEKSGSPEKAFKLKLQVEDEVAFDELIGTPKDIEAEKATTPEPPRTGPGSGVEAWRSFAKLVTNMSAEVIDDMKRDEIILVLEEGDYITSEDPTGEEDS